MEVGSMKKRKQMYEEDVRRFLELYPVMSNKEVAMEIGISEHTVRSRAVRMGLKKDPGYISRLRSEINIRCGRYDHLNTPDAIEKRAASIRKRFETERRRLRWGLEKTVSRHLRLEPREKLLQRNRLQRLGYVVDEENLVAYWTEGTKRAKRLERLKRGEKKGSLKCWYDFAELKEK